MPEVKEVPCQSCGKPVETENNDGQAICKKCFGMVIDSGALFITT